MKNIRSKNSDKTKQPSKNTHNRFFFNVTSHQYTLLHPSTTTPLTQFQADQNLPPRTVKRIPPLNVVPLEPSSSGLFFKSSQQHRHHHVCPLCYGQPAARTYVLDGPRVGVSAGGGEKTRGNGLTRVGGVIIESLFLRSAMEWGRVSCCVSVSIFAAMLVVDNTCRGLVVRLARDNRNDVQVVIMIINQRGWNQFIIDEE